MASALPTPAFIDWWFAPWRNGGPPLPASCVGELARRDAYRHWCAQAGIAAQLPLQADWDWQGAAAVDGATLVQAAELFGGLLAARRQRLAELANLSPAQRRWCLAVALAQPLADWSDLPVATPRQRGLREFALRAELALPGLWARLALLLPEPVRLSLAPVAGTLHARDRRCWLMCVAQARQGSAA
jgi:hypothetical protein